jgi:hypothetical protein
MQKCDARLEKLIKYIILSMFAIFNRPGQGRIANPCQARSACIDKVSGTGARAVRYGW